MRKIIVTILVAAVVGCAVVYGDCKLSPTSMSCNEHGIMVLPRVDVPVLPQVPASAASR